MKSGGAIEKQKPRSVGVGIADLPPTRNLKCERERVGKLSACLSVCSISNVTMAGSEASSGVAGATLNTVGTFTS